MGLLGQLPEAEICALQGENLRRVGLLQQAKHEDVMGKPEPRPRRVNLFHSTFQNISCYPLADYKISFLGKTHTDIIK